MTTPSIQQQAFYDWIQNGSGSCILEAVAGSGKTTSLIEALSLMQGSIFFGAYNKKIADEIKARAPKRERLFISTMHAAGFKAWKAVAPRCEVDDRKCLKLLTAMGANPSTQDAVLKLVSLAKQAAFGVVEGNNWFALIDHFDVDCGETPPGTVVREAQELLKQSIAADSRVIDFDDMIYAPLVHKCRVFEHDWVLIDEAQDTNASRRALALRLLKRGGRLVAVGDRHQAIYGFTGADADSLGAIGAAVNAQEMPLTVSFRCPQEVVKYAQNWVHHIQAAPSAPAGVVRAGDAMKEATIGDAILCRFNAPLITAAYAFIAAGKPAKVEGREIGNGLKALARKWRVRSLVELEARLETYCERETAKLRAKEKESAAVAVEDKVQCLLFLIQRQQNVGGDLVGLIAEIDALFADEGDTSNRIILSSIHKSKGREWARVFWLQTGPSPWARKEWEVEQENNLCYVAATRAKAELVLVDIQKKGQ